MMATWLEQHGVELVVARRLHAPPDPAVPRAASRTGSSTSTPRCCRRFPGAHAIDDALAAGVETTGVTVHLVDEGIDTGPVLAPGARGGRAARDARRADARRRAPAPARGRRRPARREPRPMRALISVYEKHGIEAFAAGLAELGFELVSSGGTAAFLEEHGLTVTRVEEVTGAPELLGGRVKTLHPAIHAGILARRELRGGPCRRSPSRGSSRSTSSASTSTRSARSPAGSSVDEADVIEMIDVGGPSLLRGAAKNFAHVAAVCRPEQYDPVLAELREGGLSAETRRALAAEAFALTAAYDAAIARWFAEDAVLPRPADAHLPQGHRPRLRREPAPDGRLLRGGRLAQAPALARQPARRPRALLQQPRRPRGARAGSSASSREPAVVIVKHANPCGVAVAETIEEAYERALAADPVSAFGCVLLAEPAGRRPGSGARSPSTSSRSSMAPEYDEEAIEALDARSRRCASCATASAAPTPRASATTGAWSAACSSRSATRRSTGARGWRSSPAPSTESSWARRSSSPGGSASTSARTRSCSPTGGQTIGIGAGPDEPRRRGADRRRRRRAEFGHDLGRLRARERRLLPLRRRPRARARRPASPPHPARRLEARRRRSWPRSASAGAAMVFTGRRHFRH